MNFIRKHPAVTANPNVDWRIAHALALRSKRQPRGPRREPNGFVHPGGQKQPHLSSPSFVLTLLRTTRQPPNFASFLTPLWLNKLDLKDYLYHAYGIQVLSVRSYVMQAAVTRNQKGQFHRPASKKRMTVELAQGVAGQGLFVWPKEPESLEEWGQAKFIAKQQEQQQERERSQDRTAGPRDLKSLKQQERSLLGGKVKWRPSWENYPVGAIRPANLEEVGEKVVEEGAEQQEAETVK